MNVEIKLLVKLIRAHYENDTKRFDEACKEIINLLDENKIDEEVKLYLLAVMGLAPSFVPM